ncbi:MAG: vanadium-dependent haloperoxidase [Gemmatimonadota bacterium]
MIRSAIFSTLVALFGAVLLSHPVAAQQDHSSHTDHSAHPDGSGGHGTEAGHPSSASDHGYEETSAHSEMAVAPAAGSSAAVRWIVLTRDISGMTAGHGRMGPPARTYALVTVAQLMALETGGIGVSERVAVASASAGVLAGLFPGMGSTITEWLEEDHRRARALGDTEESINEGEAAGRAAAEQALSRAAVDGADLPWSGALRNEPDLWTSSPGMAPIGVGWQQIRPWLVSSAAQFRAPPPPAFDAPEFQRDLTEVAEIARARTAEQTEIAKKWAKPVDHYWNMVASEEILRAGLAEIEVAKALTLLNVAMMDAAITCFETKYHYQFPRPSQVDPSISLAIGLPNHPSYPSAHACVTGAATTVLGHLFPSEIERIGEVGEEASLSRLYAGVHYRFDNVAGVEIGRAVARHAIERDPDEADLLRRRSQP